MQCFTKAKIYSLNYLVIRDIVLIEDSKKIKFEYYRVIVFSISQMETIKYVLCFLKELDFTDKLDNDCFGKLVEVKKMMVRKFEDYNIHKMIHALNIIDEIQLSSVTNDLDYRLERTDSLRSFFSFIQF